MCFASGASRIVGPFRYVAKRRVGRPRRTWIAHRVGAYPAIRRLLCVARSVSIEFAAEIGNTPRRAWPSDRELLRNVGALRRPSKGDEVRVRRVSGSLCRGRSKSSVTPRLRTRGRTVAARPICFPVTGAGPSPRRRVLLTFSLPSPTSARRAWASSALPGRTEPPARASRELHMSNKMIIDASHPEETRVVVLRGSRVRGIRFRIRKQEAATRQHISGQGDPGGALAPGGLHRLRRQPPRLPGLFGNSPRLLPNSRRRPAGVARRGGALAPRGRGRGRRRTTQPPPKRPRATNRKCAAAMAKPFRRPRRWKTNSPRNCGRPPRRSRGARRTRGADRAAEEPTGEEPETSAHASGDPDETVEAHAAADIGDDEHVPEPANENQSPESAEYEPAHEPHGFEVAQRKSPPTRKKTNPR